MQVSVEQSGNIERKLTISVPPDKIDSEVSKRLKDVARKARIPGFRPGKAPHSVIRKRYEPQVTHDVVSETINASYVDALGRENIVPAGLVSIDPSPYEPGKNLEFVATIELFPEIPHPSLDGVKMEIPVVEVTDADVDRTLEEIRNRNPAYEAGDGESGDGDRLTIDFAGRLADGSPFSGGSADDFQFVLGKGQMLEEFDAALHGVRAGDTRTINLTFPENYGSEAISGKDVAFQVTVKEVAKPRPAELDDAFAAAMGVAEGGIGQMKKEVRMSLERELSAKLRSLRRDQVMDELFGRNQFDLPKALVEDEVERSVQAVREQLKASNLPDDKVDREHFVEDARRRVALGLIAREVISRHEIKAGPEEIKARVEEMAASYEDKEAFVNWNLSDPRQRERIENEILESKIVDCMLATAEVNDKAMSFKEFMDPPRPDGGDGA